MKSSPVNSATACRSGETSARSALLVFVIASLISGAVFAQLFLVRLPSKETAAFAGVGAASGAVLSLWAAILAARSFRREEAVKLSASVCAVSFALFAAMVLGIYSEATRNLGRPYIEAIFANAVLLGLPFFLPMLIVASIFAVPIARVRARRIEAREKAAGRPEWTTTYRFKRMLRLYAFWVVFASLPLLPHTFFLFAGASAYNMNNWRARTAATMPAFIGDQLCAFLEMFPSNRFLDHWQTAIISFGNLSPAGVRANLASKKPNVAEAAAYRIERLDPAPACEIALEILASQNGFVDQAAYALGKHGTREQILPLLEYRADEQTLRGERIFIALSRSIVDYHRVEFVPQYDAHIRDERLQFFRDPAFPTLARLLNPERAVEFWTGYLKLPTICSSAAWSVQELDLDTRLAIFIRALEEFDDKHLFEFQNDLGRMERRADSSPTQTDKLKKLLEYLDDKRLQRRRFATFCLARQVGQKTFFQPRLETPEGELERARRAEIRADTLKLVR